MTEPTAYGFFLGQAPKTSIIPTTSSSKLRGYRLEAGTGRMPSRKIPLFPKFGYSITKPTELPRVSSVETSVPDSLETLSKDKPHTIHVPTSQNGTRPKHIHTRTTLPILTTGAFWLPTPHLGDPCTLQSLDHILTCGHKILTPLTPQPCALNCHTRSTPDLLQPRDIGASFACTACIVEHLARRHTEREEGYLAELRACSTTTTAVRDDVRRGEGGAGNVWIQAKLRFVSLAWQDEDVAEFRALYGRGKASSAPWIEPAWQGVVDLGSVVGRARMGERREFVDDDNESARPAPPTPTANSVASRSTSIFSSWRKQG